MPFTLTQKNNIPGRDRQYMETTIQVSDTSYTVLGQTHVWTRQPWVGFTGGVRVLALDANDIVLDYTSDHSFGVDGFRVFWKTSDRQVMWFDYLDPQRVAAMTHLGIVQFHDPHNRLQAILDETVATAQTIGDAYAQLAQLGIAVL